MSHGLRRAALSTGSAQYVIYALSFVRLIIISRILTSAEIGAFVLSQLFAQPILSKRQAGFIIFIFIATIYTVQNQINKPWPDWKRLAPLPWWDLFAMSLAFSFLALPS